jgi:HK97 family phage portal protein
MGLVFGSQKRGWSGGTGNPFPQDASAYIPARGGGPGGPPVVNESTARRNSAVWAALRLRADLISTLPVDAYRRVGSVQVEAPKGSFMSSPGFMTWLYSTQTELDSTGNNIGIIRAVDGLGLPAEIEAQPSAACSLQYKDNRLSKYRINGVDYDPSVIWHEKQYTVPGLDVGLSPIAYSAWTLGQYQTIQQFAAHWFMSGAGPRASLRNTEKKITPKEALVTKEAWSASQSMGEPFVHGNDWEYSLIQAEQASADWLEAQRASHVDVARFFSVPADLIDAYISGPNITYANVVQRNLQFLVMNLAPAIIRRENALSQLIPRPRFVKLNSDSILRMDPATRAQVIRTKIDSRVLAPSEARALDNLPPFTAAQLKEFKDLGLVGNSSPPPDKTPALLPAPPTEGQ